MTLKEYYKIHLYDYGYNKGYDDGVKGEAHTLDPTTPYFRDEMDFYICADYYGSYVGGLEDWTEEDVNFLFGLGFSPEDFEPEEEDEMTRAEFEREFREGR